MQSAAIQRSVRVLRSAWKRPIGLPAAMEARRVEMLKQRTGPQLALLCKRLGEDGAVGDGDLALMNVWQRLAPQYAIASRVLREVSESSPFSFPKDREALAVGEVAATVGALREAWPRTSRTLGVEVSDAHRDAARYVLDDVDARHVEWAPTVGAVALSSPSPEKAFGLVTCVGHLSRIGDAKLRDAHLAILWGCVEPGGVLAIVEAEASASIVADARAALLGATATDDRPQVLGPCPHDRPACNHPPPVWPQTVRSARGGPQLRSTRKATAGAVVATRRAHTIEKFAYLTLRRPHPNDDLQPQEDGAISARILQTPLKNGGHVICDVCTSQGTVDRITLSKANLKRDGTASFKDARKATRGSLLRYTTRTAPSESRNDADPPDPESPPGAGSWLPQTRVSGSRA